jgi:uncharacterized protein (TIGR02466 family)
MNREIIFPLEIYTDTVKEKSILDELYNECIHSQFKFENISDNFYNTSNRLGYQSKKNLHESKPFYPLSEAIIRNVKNLLVEKKINAIPLISSMWLNVNTKYSFNHVHTHGDWYSGILWLKTPVNCGKLFFVNPCVSAQQQINKIEGYPTEILSIQPSEGELILFPSYLPHGIEPNMSETPQFCISFNIELKNVSD